MRPTIVLVHGAFAESASWDKAIGCLAGTGHRVIAAALERFMAERADARRSLEIPGASHAAMVSHPEATAEVILEAAALPAPA